MITLWSTVKLSENANIQSEGSEITQIIKYNIFHFSGYTIQVLQAF